MVACPKCVVNNTLDSAFCKKCGAVLPVSVIEEEQEKLKEIVTKGMESYQAGNLEEALAIAEHSILTNPSYGEAYALKGLIHERRGEYAEALDSYETVVTLNPDSTIDKIKLNQLRNAFAQRQAGEPKADKKSAAILSLSVTGLVAACGLIAYGIVSNSNEKKDVQNTNVPVQNRTVSQTDPRISNVGQNTNQYSQPETHKPNQTTNPGDVQALGGASATDNNPNIDSRPRSTPRYNGGGGLSGEVTPAFIEGGIGNNSGGPGLPNPANNPGQKQNNPQKNVPDESDPAPTPKGTDNGKSNDPRLVSNTTEPDKGTYVITPSTTNGGGNGTSRNNTTEPAKNSSGAGKQFQRQGQGLARSGKNSEARQAYQRAIDAYEKEISSGSGDKEAAQAGLNSCKQALKNLKD